MHEILVRGWTDLLARLDGPLHFRFIAQPLMALFLGARAGIRDARAGEPPFLSALFRFPERRGQRMKDALRDVATLLLVATILDSAYQVAVHRGIYLLELLITVALLALVPYLLVRGPMARLAPATGEAALGFGQLVVVMGLMLFAPAGTLRWVAGWVFLSVFFGSSLAITIYLARKDPALLRRRTQAGPLAEKERSQKIIQGLAGISFLATIVLPSLDHRFGWSHVPLPVVVAGDAFVVVGFLIVFLVFRANTFTSSVIEVATEQRVIDTGPYAVVRHPMYAGALVLLAGMPLALGSLVGLATFPPFVAIIVLRLLDEERFLLGHLPGYAAYRQKTRHRLVPHVW
jgi:protein-S-isoprenylcysteine O-methyltransferase Ste14